MAVTKGPSKEYLEQMQEYGRQASAAAAQAAAAKMGMTNTQRAQAAQAASMAQRQQAGTKTQTAAAATPYSYKPGDTMAGVSAGTRAKLDSYQNGYNPSAAVLDAQNALAAIQGQKPGAYNPSAAVQEAQSILAQIQNQKPQGYTSKYSDQLDSILGQIQNPEGFKWDFNGDELFKTYADMYNRKGQQAMMDAIGNASALTGGYGNSYATQVGQQTYDEYMNDLFNVGMDLRDRAYQIYQDNKNDLYNRYNMLQNADETDYGRYRDTVGDWQNDLNYYTNRADQERNFDYGTHRDEVGDWQNMLDYYTGRADTERNFDYGQFADMMNYWTNMANAENADYWTYENLEWDKLSTAQKLAMDNVATMLQLGIAPSMETLLKAGYSAADAQAIMAALAGAVAGGSGGGYGGGGGGSSSGGSSAGDTIYNTASQIGNGMAGLGAALSNAVTNAAAQKTLSDAASASSIPYKEYIFGDTWNKAAQQLINGGKVTLPDTNSTLAAQLPKTTSSPASGIMVPVESQKQQPASTLTNTNKTYDQMLADSANWTNVDKKKKKK